MLKVTDLSLEDALKLLTIVINWNNGCYDTDDDQQGVNKFLDVLDARLALIEESE